MTAPAPPAEPAVRRPGSPLRQPRFQRLWLGGFVSDFGDWLLLIAMPVFVFETTGSTGSTAVTFLFGLLPGMALSPAGGWLADRFDRVRLMSVLLPVQALALLPLLFVHGRSGLPVVYAVVAVQSALEACIEPAKQAQVPSLVEPAQLVAANSLMGLTQNLGRLVGGPVGGLLIAAHDLSIVVLADATTFLVAAALIATTAAPAARRRDRRRARATASPERTGLRALPRERRAPVLGVFAVTFVSQVAQGLFLVLFVVFVGRELHGDGGLIGLLRGVQAIGAIAAGLVLGLRTRSQPSPARLVSWSLLAFGIVSAVIWNAPGLTTAVAFYVAGFVLVGAPGIIADAGLTATLQAGAPAHLTGRLFGIHGALANLGVVLGILLAATAGSVGLHTLLDVQVAIYLGAGVIAALTLRRRGTG